jgi:hypothetical protein
MNARKHRVPKYGTGPHIALRALHTLEGQANDARWHASALRLLGTKASGEQWGGIVQTLINTAMIFNRGGVFVVSDDGLEWLGVAAAVVPRAEPEAAPARYIPPMRPLSAMHLVNVLSTREGAFDYRDIPSLHGVERVAYRSTLKVAEVSQE